MIQRRGSWERAQDLSCVHSTTCSMRRWAGLPLITSELSLIQMQLLSISQSYRDHQMRQQLVTAKAEGTERKTPHLSPETSLVSHLKQRWLHTWNHVTHVISSQSQEENCKLFSKIRHHLLPYRKQQRERPHPHSYRNGGSSG